jgi:hypothetical protein
MEQLNPTAAAGKPMSLTLLGAGLIPQAIRDGTLQTKIMAEEPAAERHLWRYVFMAWDRVRTGEYDPWTCTLCERDYSGLRRCLCLASSTIPAKLRSRTSLPPWPWCAHPATA